MTAAPAWRLMRPADVPAVFALSEAVHPAFPERDAIYHDRMALFPQGCLVLDAGSRIEGYGVAYPARLGAPPPLDTVLGELPRDADALYIHDVAISADMRGRRLADIGIRWLVDVSQAFAAAMLVSVYGTAAFWSRFGFKDETQAIDPRKLAAYGPGARYMVRSSRDAAAGAGRDTGFDHVSRRCKGTRQPPEDAE